MAGKAVRATVECTGKVPRYNTAGVREREDAHRTREAGNRDEVEGVVANRLNLFRKGAVGFIEWLGLLCVIFPECGGRELYRICGGV
jgi:hypothetical protein